MNTQDNSDRLSLIPMLQIPEEHLLKLHPNNVAISDSMQKFYGEPLRLCVVRNVGDNWDLVVTVRHADTTVRFFNACCGGEQTFRACIDGVVREAIAFLESPGYVSRYCV